MGKTARKIWNAVTTFLVAVVVAAAVLLVGVRLVGLQAFAVLSGSMEPAYRTGSMIYVKETDYRDIKAGDVITFLLDKDTVATHRVVEVIVDEADETVVRFRTKGDNNAAADATPVHYRNVIGSPVFSVPFLGFVAVFIQEPPGTYVAVIGSVILLLLVFVPDFLGSGKKAAKTGDKD